MRQTLRLQKRVGCDERNFSALGGQRASKQELLYRGRTHTISVRNRILLGREKLLAATEPGKED